MAILAFEYHIIKEDDVVYAVCDHAHLASHGKDEREALTGMEDAVRLYINTLLELGELEEAIADGRVVEHKEELPRVHIERIGTRLEATVATGPTVSLAGAR